ncbi:MAG: universal stress protein [Rhizobiales bacterium]|nr:universal stress protein [Hyphomicrobiales bacterium]
MSGIFAFIDGSAYAQSVCELTAWAAERMERSVEIAHVLGRRQVINRLDLSGNLEFNASSELLKELADLDAQSNKLAQQKGRTILEYAKSVVQSAGVSDVTVRLRNGDLLEALSDFEKDAALIVIGKRGEASEFAKLHLGSNLERVVRSSKKPVLVAARAHKPINSFLIAYDGGKSAMRAIEFLVNSPLLKNLSCHLLSVGDDTATMRANLDVARGKLESVGYVVNARVLPGDPEAVIVQQIEADHIDLLVMGAYGHSRIRNLVIGSTTTAMVNRCKVPVLMVH